MNIQSVLDSFLSAWESGDFSDPFVMKEDAVFVLSTQGILRGKDEIISALTWKEHYDYQRIRVFNLVTRGNDFAVCQSCYLLFRLGRMINGYMHHFDAGMRVVIRYEDDLICELRGSLVYESGNTLLVESQWKLIDYGKWEGCDVPIITKNMSPWHQIEKDTLEKNTFQQVFEVFCHYCWCVDLNDSETLSRDVLADHFQVSFPPSLATDKDGFVRWLKTKRERTVDYDGISVPKEPCWSHMGCPVSFTQIDEDHAFACINRIEPNRIGNRFLHKYNMDSLVWTAVWRLLFVRTNGKWMMEDWQNELLNIEDQSKKDKRYF